MYVKKKKFQLFTWKKMAYLFSLFYSRYKQRKAKHSGLTCD